jgi:iron complex outermembrane recepter protein
MKIIRAAAFAWSFGAAGFSAGQKAVDLTEMSLEDLMKVQVTLVSRKPEKMTEAAAAVYVLTHDDIRRSGATNLPDVLRLVPGMQVARIDANKWAISARGFMDFYANKLLVLIDGRSVYSPIFSGVLWESQDVFLWDVDRIEVVRGPGGTLWGANAVNGVVNIVTRRSQETQGKAVQLGSGTEERGFGGLRIGGTLGRNAAYRIYASVFDRSASVFLDDSRAADAWRFARGGFRMDWDVRPGRSATLQGDLYFGHTGQTFQIPGWNIRLTDFGVRLSGGNLLGRWTRTFSATSEMIFQTSFDQVSRKDTLLVGGEYQVWDADFQHRFRLNGNHSVVWGAGYRLIRDRSARNTLVTFVPPRRRYGVASAFLQDEISCFHDRFRLVPGTKFEHNDFTGLEFQPGFRMLFLPRKGWSLWGAVSRAVRTPTRVESDIRVVPILFGNPRFRSERLDAFEAGCHVQPSERFYANGSVFYNRYGRLSTVEGTTFGNRKSARTAGFEADVNWSPAGWWRLRGGYTTNGLDIDLEKGSLDTRSNEAGKELPRHQATLHSGLKLPGKIDLDLIGRYFGRLPAGSLKVPAVAELDIRLEWEPSPGTQLSIVGRNLLHRRHPEFPADWLYFAATQVPRSAYAAVVFDF